MGDKPDSGQFSNDRVLAVFPKNGSTEGRIVVKEYKTKSTGVQQGFFDFREYWYKDGPMVEPIATRKGTMIHRHNAGKVVVAVLTELQPGEINEDELEIIRQQLVRLSSAE